MFQIMYPTKRILPIQMITSLKDKGLDYQSKLRAKSNIQGCFINVKLYNELDAELQADLNNKESPFDAGVIKSKVEDVKKHIEVLDLNDELINKLITSQDNEMKNLTKIQELEMMIIELKKQLVPILSVSEIDSITNVLNF